jgi:CSLREA domain-containing protein
MKGGENGLSRFLGVALVAAAVLALPALAPAATIQPDTNLDQLDPGNDGACSLREAVQAINNAANFGNCVATIVPDGYGTNDRINLPAATYTLSIDGTNEDANATGDLDVTKPITIARTGVGTVTLSQALATDDRILDSHDVALTLLDLTVSGGEITSNTLVGGNIRFTGNGLADELRLNNVDVTGGLVNAAGGGTGGGISATTQGPVVLENGSAISGNTAGGVVGSPGNGGGLNVVGSGPSATVTVTDSQITGNMAGYLGGAGTTGNGGGARLSALATITLTNVTVDGNRAGGGGGDTGQGGGLLIDGGSAPVVTASGGAVTHNHAGGGTSASAVGFGGGIYFTPTGGGSLSVQNASIDDNIAGGDGGRGNGAGGGILATQPVTVQDSDVSRNLGGIDPGLTGAPGLIGQGGGIQSTGGSLTVRRSTIDQNKAGKNAGFGGGIQMTGAGNLELTDDAITGNIAGAAASGGAGVGGGLDRVHPPGASPADTITRTTISGNTVVGIGLNSTRGGGAAFDSQGTVNIDASTISGNTVNQTNADPGLGGGLALNGSNAAGGTYTIVNSTVANNVVDSQGGTGGGIAVGGAFAMVPPTAAAITGSTIVANGNPALPTNVGGNLAVPAGGAGLVTLTGTLISGGTGTAGTQNCSQNVVGSVSSAGGNFEGPPSVATQCSLTGSESPIGANPMLGALALNSPGTTMTMALPPGSPALDRYSASCPATDQRGLTRPQGAACDSGAYELFVAPPGQQLPGTPTAQPTAQCAGSNATVGSRTATIAGTAGNDRITGTAGSDVIDGGGGNDQIRGLGGNDTICGDEGKDALLGGGGNDRLLGGSGKDTLRGGKGVDKLKGGPGKDLQVQ